MYRFRETVSLHKKTILIIGLFSILTALLLFPAKPARAQSLTQEEPKPVYIYLFWGEGCPHCAVARPYFKSLEQQYPGVVLRDYEVYTQAGNQEIFMKVAERYGFQISGVPTFFIGNYYMVGYDSQLNPKIEAVVQQCLQEGCPNPGEGIVDDVTGEALMLTEAPAVTPTPTTTIYAPTITSQAVHLSPTPPTAPTATMLPENTITPTPQSTATPAEVGLSMDHNINIPLLGAINLDKHSLTLSTILIAVVDGVNPCSLWVLSMLLALTVHIGSRKKVLLIGVIFLTVTAGIYALFIAGLFSVLRFASFLGWIQSLVAVVALFFAVINIKDYFWYKEGLSFTIADEKKPGIYKRMRAVVDASQSTWGLISATVVLSAGVSLVEFSCTAGFPVLWTNLVSAQNVEAAAFIFLLLLYMLIYQADELVIFLTAVMTLKASRLEEKQGRILKLIGGMLMLTLAGVMLIDPALMNNLSSSLLIFCGAFAAAGLVLLLHRVILPHFGILIGTEQQQSIK